VIDLQDIGTRFYTYMTTMAYVMEEAAADIRSSSSDRLNPRHVQIEGRLRGGAGFTGTT
jgi:uncharacterized protein YbbC (DUF1343 family)